MIGQLGKDIQSAQKRILDHKVFVRGEIENFLESFELQRNEIEVETLFKVTESTGELKYELFERCNSLATTQLRDISSELQQLLSGIESFLDKVQEVKKPSEITIKASQQRALTKSDFCKDLEYRQQRLDNSFEEKEEEISELYSDLELKLNITK